MSYLLLKCDVGKKNDRVELEKFVRNQKWEVRDLDIKVVLKYGQVVLEMDSESFRQLKEVVNGA